jgi:UDP-arabinose 4-epimerase
VKVLVAGGAGYIGSHTCKALAEAGHTPIVYDNLHTGHAWAVKWGPLERGDLNDAGTLDVVLKRHRPQAVIDFAGLIDVGESNREPALYYRNNVTSVVTLLR